MIIFIPRYHQAARFPDSSSGLVLTAKKAFTNLSEIRSKPWVYSSIINGFKGIHELAEVLGFGYLFIKKKVGAPFSGGELKKAIFLASMPAGIKTIEYNLCTLYLKPITSSSGIGYDGRRKR